MDNKFQETLLNAIAASTIKTLRDFCQIQPVIGQAFIKGKRDQQMFAVAGIIGLTSSVANGSVLLCFPMSVFAEIMKNMLGETVTEIKKENEDAAAELLNMIFGQTKAVLNKRGFSLEMAIPSVLRGGDVQSSYSKVHVVQVVPFSTPVGEFYIELLLNDVAAPKATATASVPPKVDTPAAQAAFFKPFLDSVMHTLKVQINVASKPGKPFLKKQSSDFSFDIAGIIGITSKSLSGSFMLSFKKEVFLKLIGKMFGEEPTDFQEGLDDAVSELVNIVLGAAKAVLNTQGHGIQMAIPTVVRGDSILSSPQHKKQGIVIPFTSDVGEFHVEVIINDQEPPAA
ncbi:MAG TPA: hypothetical protein DCS07_09040 [Bdellovibrionales bacterium]|nr:MAG: hypothetical protein A2Z97_05445 [Bdellovibrionales bacterium GWB1_52_6]OFZ05714.1 MAG: hypothetical protein A2X97_03350 [Bdellovibrionales bacterium GWA1_52_35]OFZ40663.1 MAG: hypothetical protein A2070_06355 [Bdellovibrionales bacterium GWC1_52_8]HAR42755.1 hypothetical protein [Bdellovibrionales bacterium]HCM40348.1 hypothetical protein [Bdellovibrionales bacterium]